LRAFPCFKHGRTRMNADKNPDMSSVCVRNRMSKIIAGRLGSSNIRLGSCQSQHWGLHGQVDWSERVTIARKDR